MTVLEQTAPIKTLIAVGGKHWAQVDPEDYDRLAQFTWCLARSGNRRTIYAQRRLPSGTTQMMHNFITGLACVDHRNHDGLDNRRVNLRDGSGTNNARNQRKSATGKTSSRYKGVSWRKPDRSHGVGWEASIRKDGRQVYLGKFSTEIEAAWAYDTAAREHYGEYACLNFPVNLAARPGEIVGYRKNGKPIYLIAGGAPRDGEDGGDDKSGGDKDADDSDDQDDADDSDKDDDGDADWKAKYEAQQKINRGLERKGKKDLARIKVLETKPVKKADDKGDDDQPDIEKIKADAKAEAAAEQLRGRVEDKIEAKARAFADPEDAVAVLLRKHDIEDFIDDGKLDVDAITEALGDLAEKKPHLLAKGKKFEGDADGGARSTKTARPKSMGEALARHYGGTK